MKTQVEEAYPKYVVFMAEDTFSSLLWDDEDAGIGDVEHFWIGDKEYSLESLEGIKEWFYKADKYDPIWLSRYSPWMTLHHDYSKYHAATIHI